MPGRLDQVAGVHGAARGGTGADDRMDLVDEEDGVGQLLQLGEHGLQAFFEVAAVLGARDQRAQVERIDGGVRQHFGHFAVDDALGQALRDRGLADARLSHVERIVLAAAAKHLDGALDFVDSSHQWVNPAFARKLIEVDRELGRAHLPSFAVTTFTLARFAIVLLGRRSSPPCLAMPWTGN
jgi:hypothetical protein